MDRHIRQNPASNLQLCGFCAVFLLDIFLHAIKSCHQYPYGFTYGAILL